LANIDVVAVPAVRTIDSAIYEFAAMLGACVMSLQLVVETPLGIEHVNVVDVMVGPVDPVAVTKVKATVSPAGSAALSWTIRFVDEPDWGTGTAAAVKPAIPVVGNTGPNTLPYPAVAVAA
jgi:hypothetical protein